MNKQELLEKYYKDEDKLLIARVFDKINFTKTKNKISCTDFLDMYQRKICENILHSIKEKHYVFYGGFKEADKNMLIIYPEKLETIFQNNQFDYNELIKVIKIVLPNDLRGQYNHRDYLSGLMKLGIKREKCGDILVTENGAYIITSNELATYICNNICELTRFSKSKIDLIKLDEMEIPEIRKEEKKIIVSSMRLDNIIPELAHTSRTMANDIINEQRVFVNYENETRKSRLITEDDIIVIRGKGKFKISKIEGSTSKGKNICIIEHFI